MYIAYQGSVILLVVGLLHKIPELLLGDHGPLRVEIVGANLGFILVEHVLGDHLLADAIDFMDILLKLRPRCQLASGHACLELGDFLLSTI